eukprot:88708-Alexandrium_andersonii.AAC.1
MLRGDLVSEDTFSNTLPHLRGVIIMSSSANLAGSGFAPGAPSVPGARKVTIVLTGLLRQVAGSTMSLP